MGTIRNEITIVHHWDLEKINSLRKTAVETFNKVEGYEHLEMVSPIMKSFMNSEYTFIINGECSKVGWGIAERFHKIRMEWCKKHKESGAQIVVVNLGEDDRSYIVFDSESEEE